MNCVACLDMNCLIMECVAHFQFENRLELILMFYIILFTLEAIQVALD